MASQISCGKVEGNAKLSISNQMVRWPFCRKRVLAVSCVCTGIGVEKNVAAT